MAAPTNMHNLMTLIKRLEAATSRLEDIATSVDSSHADTIAAINKANLAPVPVSAAATPVPTPEPVPASIADFDLIIKEDVQAFVSAAEKIGGLVEEQAKSVLEAFKAERTYLLVTTKAKKPNPQPPELLTELHRQTGSVDDIREVNRASPLFSHLSAISEGIVALGWIMDTKPADHVTNALGGAQYYGNKVLKEYKEKDTTHTEYIQAYYQIFKKLISYIKQHFSTGITWNATEGMDALEALKEVQSGSSHTTTDAPPPPPPPMPPVDGPEDATPRASIADGSGSGGDMTAVFGQLNQGSAVTSGLRKVDKSEMTHKNPTLRAGGIVPERSNSQGSATSSNSGKSGGPSKKPKPESMRTKKPSKKELDGNKWIVENFENTGSEIVEIHAQLSQSVLISRCTKCVVKVVGKANAISVDNCTGLSIMVDSLVSSLDVIKSPKFQVQIDGVVPTIMLDQVDGASIYLGMASLTTEVFTSKSSSINIVLPPDGKGGDDKECPIPEQIRSFVKNGKVLSEIVQHAG